MQENFLELMPYQSGSLDFDLIHFDGRGVAVSPSCLNKSRCDVIANVQLTGRSPVQEPQCSRISLVIVPRLSLHDLGNVSSRLRERRGWTQRTEQSTRSPL